MTTMMTERSGLAMPGMAGTAQAPTMTPASMNMMMVPRCTIKFEKCEGGMRIDCVCEDKVSAGMLQNLCTMMAGGMVGCCMMMNGMPACTCSLMMAMCKCEPTAKGVCITCTSGDKACCAMIQACCDCCSSMTKAGCTRCLTLNNMPVCCGTC